MADSPSGIRASDADRERIAQIIRAASGEGLLTLEEADERLASVYAAKYLHDLEPLTQDLPDRGLPLIGEQPPRREDPRRGWEGPRGWQRGRGPLAGHGVTVLVIGAVLIGLWALSGAHFFWPIWPIAFLALGWFRHARWSGHGRC
jgi:hypothetical protein